MILSKLLMRDLVYDLFIIVVWVSHVPQDAFAPMQQNVNCNYSAYLLLHIETCFELCQLPLK